MHGYSVQETSMCLLNVEVRSNTNRRSREKHSTAPIPNAQGRQPLHLPIPPGPPPLAPPTATSQGPCPGCPWTRSSPAAWAPWPGRSRTRRRTRPPPAAAAAAAGSASPGLPARSHRGATHPPHFRLPPPQGAW